MQTLEAQSPLVTMARPYVLSIEKYEAMVAAGVLTEDDKTELLDGRLTENLPLNPPHASATKRTRRFLEGVTEGSDRDVWSGRPVVVPPRSVPVPDICVVDLREDEYANAHPRADQTHLIVEVSDETLRTDRKVKLPICALARIPEVWILNTWHRQLERYTDSISLEDGEGAYAKTQVFARDAILGHERFGAIEVAKLLPVPAVTTEPQQDA